MLPRARAQVLQPPHGVVLVAAKSYYFGVGGGVQSFLQATANDNLFEVQRVHSTSESVMHAVSPYAPQEQQQQGEQPAGEEPDAKGNGAASGGVLREVLELAFPASIMPYFL